MGLGQLLRRNRLRIQAYTLVDECGYVACGFGPDALIIASGPGLDRPHERLTLPTSLSGIVGVSCDAGRSDWVSVTTRGLEPQATVGSQQSERCCIMLGTGRGMERKVRACG